jgi:hypothetical protein
MECISPEMIDVGQCAAGHTIICALRAGFREIVEPATLKGI